MVNDGILEKIGKKDGLYRLKETQSEDVDLSYIRVCFDGSRDNFRITLEMMFREVENGPTTREITPNRA